MAFRVSTIGDHRFDERLVLYGWLEDRDFAAALARKGGKLVKIANAYGVHMGTKVGRVAGDRLGYSQVVNPIYMLRKGTMTIGQVSDHMFRNLTSNIVLSIRPEPYVDRVGRLRGNLRGLADELLARLDHHALSARVGLLIREHPGGGKERIADQLGRSGRHLIRRLADEGTSFKLLRDTLLRERAEQALRDGRRVADLAAELGFSDESACAKAFKRWTGETPARFRREEPS